MESADDARAAIREQTPLAARTVAELGRGTDSVAYLVDDEWVARFPLVADARETLRRELALLPMLAPALPVAIPAVEHVGRRDGELLFAVYRLLAGEPLGADAEEEALAGLAATLGALHAFPVAQATRAGVRAELLKGGYHDGQRELVRIVESVPGGRTSLGSMTPSAGTSATTSPARPAPCPCTAISSPTTCCAKADA